MKYNPLKTMNPTDEDLTLNSSVWLASRLMPGRGHNRVSFPHFKIINNAAMRTCFNSTLMTTGLLAMTGAETVANLQASAGSMVWRGCWGINEQPVIGHCTQAQGLAAPINTFNAGYRYRRGWRPRRTN